MINIKFDPEKLIESYSRYINAKTYKLYFDIVLLFIFLILVGLLFKDLRLLCKGCF